MRPQLRRRSTRPRRICNYDRDDGDGDGDGCMCVCMVDKHDKKKTMYFFFIRTHQMKSDGSDTR